MSRSPYGYCMLFEDGMHVVKWAEGAFRTRARRRQSDRAEHTARSPL